MKTLELEGDQVEVVETPSLSATSNKPTQKVTSMKQARSVMIVIFGVAVLSGVGTGFGIYKLQAQGTRPSDPEIANIKEGSPTENVVVGDVYGSPNEEIFKDSAEGIVQTGGIDGEGTHKLLRDGGVSQTVYMTSSVVDLDKFEGAKVKVWGETNSSKKAGWLMDVGRVKVIELNAELPDDFKATATPESKNSKKKN